MTDVDYQKVQFQPEAYTFDSAVIVRPLQEINIASRLYPEVQKGNIEDLQAYYMTLTDLSKPVYQADVTYNVDSEVLSSQKSILDYPVLEKPLKWKKMEWLRVIRDIADVDEHVAALAPKFADMRDVVMIAGHSDPSIAGKMDSTRSTYTLITNKDATTYVGVQKMITEMQSDLRGYLKGAYYRIPQWVLMTSDVYDWMAVDFATYNEDKSALDWCNDKFGPENVLFSDHLGATVTDNVSAEDGTSNIVLGTHSLETGVALQTDFMMDDVSNPKMIEFDFMQRYRPKTLRATGFINEPDVTVV